MSTSLTPSPAWRALLDHQRTVTGLNLRDLFEQDAARFERFSLRCGDLLLDFSKNLVTAETLKLLTDLGRERELEARIAAMFRGERINSTENRAALHVALRANRPVLFEGADVAQEADRTFERMRTFCEGVRGGTFTGYSGRPFTDVVNIGIGGSDLGPALVAEALAPYAAQNLDTISSRTWTGAQLANVLAQLNAERRSSSSPRRRSTTLVAVKRPPGARVGFSRPATPAAARAASRQSRRTPAARERRRYRRDLRVRTGGRALLGVVAVGRSRGTRHGH
jgi:glucose-6-phosphate isomerase